MRCDPEDHAPAEPSALESILDENLSRLACPTLAGEIRATRPRRVEVLPCPRGGETLRLCGVAFASPLDPRAEAESWAASLGLGSEDAVVLLGLGLGDHLRALFRRTSSPILVVEPSHEVARTALARSRFDRERLQIVDTPQALRESLSLRLRYGHTIRLVCWPPYERWFPELVTACGAAVKQAARVARITSNTLHVNLPHWIRNVLENAVRSVGRIAARSLDDSLRGRPAVIVAAGPSLDHNVHELARHRDRVAIFGVNTSMGALERAGVRADYLVSVEMLDVSPQLVGLELNARTPRLLDLVAHPALHDPELGVCHPFVGGNACFTPLGARAGLGEGIPTGGSVATVAFSLARLMGADPLILVGQDLAYTDGKVYAQGTIFEKMRARVEGGIASLEGLEAKRRINPDIDRGSLLPRVAVDLVDGWGDRGPVVTNSEFNYFRYALERWAASFPPPRVINATEGGARIRGFEERALAELLSELPPQPPLPSLPAGVIREEKVRRAIEVELEGACRVVRLARAAGRLESTPALSDLREAIYQAPLAYAATWSILEEQVRSEDSSPRVFCQRVVERTEEIAEEIAGALGSLDRRCAPCSDQRPASSSPEPGLPLAGLSL
jgi:hypothetical protein